MITKFGYCVNCVSHYMGVHQFIFLLCEVIELYLSFCEYIPIGCLFSENIQLLVVFSGYITIVRVLNLGALLTVFHISCGYTNWMYFLFNGCMSIGWLLNLGVFFNCVSYLVGLYQLDEQYMWWVFQL